MTLSQKPLEDQMSSFFEAYQAGVSLEHLLGETQLDTVNLEQFIQALKSNQSALRSKPGNTQSAQQQIQGWVDVFEAEIQQRQLKKHYAKDPEKPTEASAMDCVAQQNQILLIKRIR